MAANFGGANLPWLESPLREIPEVSEGTCSELYVALYGGTPREGGKENSVLSWRLHGGFMGFKALGKNMMRNVELDHFRKKNTLFSGPKYPKNPIKTGNFEDQYTLRHTGSKPSIGGSSDP